MALIAPAAIPPTTATQRANRPNCADTGNDSPIISLTERPHIYRMAPNPR